MSENLPLIGNPSLHRQLEGNRIGHAYIISGPEGSGRHTTARWLAMKLVCRESDAPCGQCTACRKAKKNVHPDIITVDGKMNTADAKDFHADIYVAPNEAERKVYVIEHAELLKEQVQNILLKSIEEGPRYAAFLLLAEHSGTLLPTVRSRCAELKLAPVGKEPGIEWLSRMVPEAAPEDVSAAFEEAQGYVGAAMKLLRKGDVREQTPADLLAETWCSALAAGDESAFVLFMGANEKKKRAELIDFSAAVRKRLHAALLLSMGAPSRCDAESVEALAILPDRTLMELDGIFREAESRLEGNAGAGHLLSWLSVRCAEQVCGI